MHFYMTYSYILKYLSEVIGADQREGVNEN